MGAYRRRDIKVASLDFAHGLQQILNRAVDDLAEKKIEQRDNRDDDEQLN